MLSKVWLIFPYCVSPNLCNYGLTWIIWSTLLVSLFKNSICNFLNPQDIKAEPGKTSIHHEKEQYSIITNRKLFKTLLKKKKTKASGQEPN